VADAVGLKLRALGSACQVLCITHLPQVAACADTHFLIDKRVRGGRTSTTVVRLDAGGRIGELARMLGGQRVTDGIRASAREMLQMRCGLEAPARPPGAKAKGESERGGERPGHRGRAR
jgi:DNA repair protein RecN (Recombination protein N)